MTYIITRWLSLEAAVGHALRLLPSYFLSEDKSPRFERFREHFENPILEAYLSFYQFSLKVFIKLNLLLQREDPLISHVHGHIQRFLKKLTLKFLNSVRNSPRRSANAEAFAEAYLRFSVSPSAKKNAEAIEWWCWWCFSHKFQTWFHDTDHLLYYPHISMFSFHTFAVFS